MRKAKKNSTLWQLSSQIISRQFCSKRNNSLLKNIQFLSDSNPAPLPTQAYTLLPGHDTQKHLNSL